MKKSSELIYYSLLLVLVSYSIVFAWVKPNDSEIILDNAISNLSKLSGFSSRINPTPESSATEKKRFFQAIEMGENYEPKFTYFEISSKAHKAAAELKKLPLAEGFYKNFLEESRKLILQKFELLSLRGTKKFSNISNQLIPIPNKTEVLLAKKFITKHGIISSAKNLTLSDQDMANKLLTILKKRGLNKWKVRISEKMSASASVSPGSRFINIKKGVKFNQVTVERFIHHEIGVHAQRAEYGHAMPLKIFSVGLKDYLVTEEGMAANNEEMHGIHEGLDLFTLRVLAVDWASRISFSEVFKNLCKLGVDKEHAWKLTLRVKRGLTDTSMPGCYSKDCSYFRGYLLVKNYLASGGKWDDLMRFGKVSINHINKLIEIEKIKSK